MSLKKIKTLPSQTYLKLLFDYTPTTGSLKWKKVRYCSMKEHGWTMRRVNRYNSEFPGKDAGHEFSMSSGKRSRQTRLDSKIYYNHRLIWKWMLDVEPDIIDHEDGDPLNNIWINLRSVPNQINSKNSSRNIKNTPGCTGVSWNKLKSKWEAYIWKDYKKYNLGLYVDINDAIKVRKEKEKEFDFHKTHGREPTDN